MDACQKTEILAEKIDWIAYTQKNNVDWNFPHYISDKWKAISPLRNYTNGQENQQGVKRFWNTISAQQGRMVLLDGSASHILLDNQENFLYWLNGMDVKPTRLDFALDIIHSKFPLRSVVKHLRCGDYISHAQSAMQVHDEFKGGFTQYVGTKTSETYTRIYDKAKEQNTDFSWTRIETVYQGDRAEASLQAYLQCKSTRSLIKRHVDFPKWAAWQRVMSGSVAEFRLPVRETRTRAWLLSQVAKSLAKEIAMDEKRDFLNEFLQRVDIEIERIQKLKTVVEF